MDLPPILPWERSGYKQHGVTWLYVDSEDPNSMLAQKLLYTLIHFPSPYE